MRTVIGVNDPQAVKKWSTALGVAVNKASYFARKMMGMGKDSRLPIQRMDELESDAGDEVTYDLLMPMNMEPVVGDETLDGKEQPLKYYTDKMRIDQVRGGADLGSRMTRKRTLRNIRTDAKRVMTDWWKRLYDELFFIYLSGSRGTQTGYIWPAGSAFFNINTLTAPDSMHLMYGGNATSKASIAADDPFDLRLIDKAVAKAETMGGDGGDDISMLPCEVDGDERYVCLMHTFQYDAMKSNTNVGQWLDIQKAAAAAEGTKAPLYKNNGGVYADVVLHKHRNVIGFSDYGAGANLPARRALFLGAQAAAIAFGSPGTGLRFDWTEEVKDHGNAVKIGSNSIFGVKKVTYKSKDSTVQRDFGVIAMDTYAVDPNA
jgi:N4-gp56 family major capsid protein